MTAKLVTKYLPIRGPHEDRLTICQTIICGRRGNGFGEFVNCRQDSRFRKGSFEITAIFPFEQLRGDRALNSIAAYYHHRNSAMRQFLRIVTQRVLARALALRDRFVDRQHWFCSVEMRPMAGDEDDAAACFQE